MAVRLLHVADVHLGRGFAYLGDAAASRRQDLVETFERICTLALEKDVSIVLIAGDLFDSFNPAAPLVDLVRSQLARLQSAGVRTFVAPGDNDSSWYEGSVWQTTTFPGTHVFSSATFQAPQQLEVGGVRFTIHGLAHNPVICPAPLEALHPSDSGVHIALMHATVDPPESMPVERRFLPVSRLDLFHSGMSYTALGHVHSRQTYEHGGAVMAAYPGSPEGLTQAEAGNRYVALLNFDGGAPQVEFALVNSRFVRSERLNVTGCSHEDIVRKLGLVSRDDVLLTARLVGYPNDLVDTSGIRAALTDAFFWLEVHDNTRVSLSDIVERMAAESTIGGRFARTLRRRIAATVDADERATAELALKLGLNAMRQRSSP